MATINDFIAQQVRNLTGGVQIPAASRDQILNGMSSSVLGSLTQTVARPGGMDQISALLTGKTSAAASPVTQLAGNLFSTNILSKLNLPPALSSSLSGIIPQVMGKLSGFLRDRDGDGDVDLNDILLSLRGNSGATGGGLLGGAAKSILGSILKK
ncbi:MAG: hypothetical protein J6Y63_01485 [Bacteroidales bacterium]|nr:hypothetical protein [Bacteroidales bacterium]